MSEIIFEVLEDVEGGYTATALGLGIHTRGDTLDELKAMVREAVDCFFEPDAERPSLIRLHYVRDEVLAV
jgi:predicted RNase H-like HicB family nuclease